MWHPSTASAAACLTLVAACAPAQEHTAAAPATADREAVVIELFTSQGCSSCPPADRLLTKLAAEGDGVIPLAFHVDYWNTIGWTDPFSAPQWTERQRRYAQSFAAGRVYTPQLTIDGQAECVGSDEREVRAAIEQARRQPASGRLALEILTVEDSSLKLEIEAWIDRDPEASQLAAMVAVFENELITPVKRGENLGRTLRNDRVVRTLRQAFLLPGTPGAHHAETLTVALDPRWNKGHLGVAVFLQDPGSMRIHAAAAKSLIQ